MTIICWSKDIPGYDFLGQEPEFSIKNSDVCFGFVLMSFMPHSKNRWLEKINSCNAKKKNDVRCLLSVTVIYYMHTFFVAAEIENTNEIFLNLVT